jgi:hypothetical protein
MTRTRRGWKILAIVVGSSIAVVLVGAVTVNSWYRTTERTYYGPHSDLLRVGERVTLSKDFAPASGHLIPKAESGVVQSEPAWDEDSCDPDRPIKLAFPSGEVASVPRHLLHR